MMNRKEQIEQAALLDKNAFVDDNYYAFKRAVEWADDHPNEGMVSIDKVCELLKKHIIIRGFEDVKIEWIEQFRKVMEE